MLAGVLAWPQAMQASGIQVADGSLLVTCELDKGTETVSVPLPAVISTDLRLNTPRFATLPALMKAKKKPLEILDPSAFELPPLAQHLQVVRADVPAARSGGRVLPDVASLVLALREEARVL